MTPLLGFDSFLEGLIELREAHVLLIIKDMMKVQMNSQM